MQHMSDKTYFDACWASLKVGTIVHPRTFGNNPNPPRAAQDGEVLFLDHEKHVAVVRGIKAKGKVRNTPRSVLIRQWTWEGKPIRLPKLPTDKPGSDNISPLWTALRKLEARLDSLEKALGVGQS